MNNDLEQYTANKIKQLTMAIDQSAFTAIREGLIKEKAMAEIALKAMQAKPDYHIVRLELNDAWGSETVLNAYESQLDASKCKDDHGGVIIPCYTTPQPAHTEQSEMLNKAHSLSESIGELRKQIDSSGGYDFEAQRSEQVNSPAIPDGWIKCSERMPDDEQEVLVQTRSGARYVSFYDEHTGLFFDSWGGNQINSIEHILVTHWHPVASPKPE